MFVPSNMGTNTLGNQRNNRKLMRYGLYLCLYFSLLSGCTGTNYSLLYGPVDHFDKLVKDNNYKDAAGVYAKNKESFVEKKISILSMEKVANYVDGEYSNSITGLTKSCTDNAIDSSVWEDTKTSIEKSKLLLEEYSNNGLIKYKTTHSDSVEKLKSCLSSRTDNLKKHIIDAFVKNYGSENVFKKYPIPINDEDAVFRDGFKAINAELKSCKLEEVRRFIKEYGALLKNDNQVRTDVSSIYWEVQKDQSPLDNVLLNLWGRAKFAVENGLPVYGAPQKIAIVEIGYDNTIKNVTPFLCRMESSSLSEMISIIKEDNYKPKGYDFIVYWSLNDIKVDKKITEKKQEESEYVEGYNTVVNSNYDSLMLQHNDLQNRLSSARGMYCEGFACIGKIIAINNLEGYLQQNVAALNGTPRTLQVPVYRKYNFNVNKVYVKKVVELMVNIYDVKNNSSTVYKRVIDNNKTFSVPYNIHERDRRGSSGFSWYDKEENIDKYEKDEILISVDKTIQDSLARGSLEHNMQIDSYLKEKEIVAKMCLTKENQNNIDVGKNQNIKQSDIRMNSVVVVVNPNGSIGSGVYIRKDTVLTNYHVVEGTKLLELKKYDGTETMGKVIRIDIGRDLALIKVASEGVPIKFYDGEVVQGLSVDAIGHPKGLYFTITRGIVSAVRKKKIEAGSNEVLFIQTDTPINAGNSGGPLFVGEKVIGINDMKLVSSGVEGIGFAIHYAEVLQFLASE